MTNEFNNIELTAVKATAKPGVTEGEAIKDAMLIAVSEWRNVELTYEERTLYVQPFNLVGAVFEKDAVAQKGYTSEACCYEFEAGMKELNGFIASASIRAGDHEMYKSEPFRFCPWCGTRITT